MWIVALKVEVRGNIQQDNESYRKTRNRVQERSRDQRTGYKKAPRNKRGREPGISHAESIRYMNTLENTGMPFYLIAFLRRLSSMIASAFF